MTPSIAAPKRLEAEVFHRQMNSGRNKALLLSCRGDDDELIQCVTKLQGLADNPTLHPLPSLLEWVAAALASELGIMTPKPYEVIITSPFAESIPERAIRAGATRSIGSVFGSGFVKGTQVAAALLDSSMRTAAAAVVAFDAFIHNIDRRRNNPNLLLGHDEREFIALDHGDAFAFLWPVIGAPDPVTDPLRSMLDNHALAAFVQRRGAPDLSGFRARLLALADERLAAISAVTPSGWQAGIAAGKLEQMLDTLRRRRDAADQWLPQVEAWMER